MIVTLLGAIIAFSIVVNNWVDSQKEVKLKTITPIVCPVPPPCSAAPLPKFDIKVVPIVSVEDKKNESDAGTQ